mmetsp:Transcript_6766/g.5908  ORF Transcript_6766/g.5908 Transcript_6766/m.5908 type:complete len:108 (+) Transcript_6766:249-572(+)
MKGQKVENKYFKRTRHKLSSKSGFVLDGINQSHYGIPEYFKEKNSLFYSKIRKERNKSLTQSKNSPRLPNIKNGTTENNKESDEKLKKKLKSSNMFPQSTKVPKMLK